MTSKFSWSDWEMKTCSMSSLPPKTQNMKLAQGNSAASRCRNNPLKHEVHGRKRYRFTLLIIFFSLGLVCRVSYAQQLISGALSVGSSNRVTGTNSAAFGTSNTVSGASAVAVGTSASASGKNSVSLGGSATGQNALSHGASTAGGSYASAFNNSAANGNFSFSGNIAVATNTCSAALGYQTLTASPMEVVVGLYNRNVGNGETSITTTNGYYVLTDGTAPLFVIGNGNSNTPSNAFQVRYDGKVLVNPSGDLSMGGFTNGPTP